MTQDRQTIGMRLGFGSLLLWILWLLAMNILSHFEGRAVSIVWVLLNTFPFVCAACVLLAILAAFWHSKWWSLSVIVALWVFYEWTLGIRQIVM